MWWSNKPGWCGGGQWCDEIKPAWHDKIKPTWRDEIKPTWHDEIKSTKLNKPVWRGVVVSGVAWCGGQWCGVVRSAMREPDIERERCVADGERDI